MLSVIETEEVLNQIIIAPPNEIYIEHIAEIKENFSLLMENENKKIILDFSNVSYIDCSGISLLLSIHKEKTVTLKGVTENIKELFHLTKLTAIFEFMD